MRERDAHTPHCGNGNSQPQCQREKKATNQTQKTMGKQKTPTHFMRIKKVEKERRKIIFTISNYAIKRDLIMAVILLFHCSAYSHTTRWT